MKSRIGIECCSSRSFWLLLLLAALLDGSAVVAASLELTPQELHFTDALARRQLLVSSNGEDFTRRVEYRIDDPAVAAVDATGYVVPLADGTTQIVASFGGEQTVIPVKVALKAHVRQVDFATEIVPLFSRYGCNSGGCHGKASGQNGFKLSLFGFDTQFDFQAVVQEARGRRVFATAADASLLLRKAIGAAPHGGGKRIGPGSEAFDLLHRWIESGCPPSSPDVARVVKLRISPAERVLRGGQQQQLAILAEYRDGSLRDVTRQAEYSSNLDVVASVDPDGLVSVGAQTGEATVMTRYMGQVAAFRAIVPHSPPLAELPEFQPVNEIDRLAAEKWKKLGLRPSPVADDSTYLRRATVDVCGRLPTSDEVRQFLAADGSTKRQSLVDRLLDSPDYPAYFAMRWGAILRNSQLAGADKASYAFHNWIKDMIARNRPYDDFVRGIVAAAGEWQDAPAVNWYWQMRDDQLHQTTADTAQVFLGLRLQCSRCHHHPYERWSQEDYFGLAGFFSRLGRKSFGQPPPYYNAGRPTTGEVNPVTGQVVKPKFLDGEYAEFTPEEDPRHALVDWMARPDNPYFAKVMVNRLWGHFLGRGLVHEIDDMRATNPPSNPELLDALAQEFISTKFDVKQMIRKIVTSRVYQLSAAPSEANKHDRQNFARFYGRRLIAEVFLDAVDQACGTKSNFGGMASNARAVDLPHEGFGSYFLDTFDRPKRVTGCECERASGATLAQVLLLANSDEIENKIAAGDGLIARMFKDQKPTAEMIEELYLRTFSRYPSDAEKLPSVEYVNAQEDKQRAVEDVLWALLNSKEFMWNH